MGYLINYGLVVKSDYEYTDIDEFLYLAGQTSARIDRYEDYIVVIGSLKAAWEEEKALKRTVDFCGDNDIPFLLITRGEEGEIEHDFNTENAVLWLEDDGYNFWPSKTIIPQVYVDLDSGSIVNGPIARVPVDRLLDDMTDDDVIRESQPYEI